MCVLDVLQLLQVHMEVVEFFSCYKEARIHTHRGTQLMYSKTNGRETACTGFVYGCCTQVLRPLRTRNEVEISRQWRDSRTKRENEARLASS